jgi:hypothetical protein
MLPVAQRMTGAYVNLGGLLQGADDKTKILYATFSFLGCAGLKLRAGTFACFFPLSELRRTRRLDRARQWSTLRRRDGLGNKDIEPPARRVRGHHLTPTRAAVSVVRRRGCGKRCAAARFPDDSPATSRNRPRSTRRRHPGPVACGECGHRVRARARKYRKTPSAPVQGRVDLSRSRHALLRRRGGSRRDLRGPAWHDDRALGRQRRRRRRA